jgi:hypothetical protein
MTPIASATRSVFDLPDRKVTALRCRVPANPYWVQHQHDELKPHTGLSILKAVWGVVASTNR